MKDKLLNKISDKELLNQIIMILIVLVCITSCYSPVYAQTKNENMIMVNYDKTIHLIFKSRILYVDLGSESIMASTIDNLPNILRVKATERNFQGETNISVILEDNKLYSFNVYYSDTISKVAYYPDDFSIDNQSKTISEHFQKIKGNDIKESITDINQIEKLQDNQEHYISADEYHRIINAKDNNSRNGQVKGSNAHIRIKKRVIPGTNKSSESTLQFDDTSCDIHKDHICSISLPSSLSSIYESNRNRVTTIGQNTSGLVSRIKAIYISPEHIYVHFELSNYTNITYTLDNISFSSQVKHNKLSSQDIYPVENYIPQERTIDRKQSIPNSVFFT